MLFGVEVEDEERVVWLGKCLLFGKHVTAKFANRP